MNVAIPAFAFLIAFASCSARTVVGELRSEVTFDAAKDAPADTEQADAPSPSDVSDTEAPDAGGGVGGGMGGAGGMGVGGGMGGAGGMGGSRPLRLELQPGPGQGEDVNLLTVNGQPSPSRGETSELGVQTTTLEGAPFVRRGIVRFRLPIAVAAEEVVSARLFLRHEPDIVAHVVGTRWRLGRAVGPWNAASVEWPGQPPLSADAFEPEPPRTSRDDYELDVTSFVRASLAAGEAPAFALRLVDESLLGQQVLFCASEHLDARCRPALHIELR